MRGVEELAWKGAANVAFPRLVGGHGAIGEYEVGAKTGI